MCGLAGGEVSPCVVEAALDAIAHRGPDGRGIAAVGGFVLGHVRLAIQDLSDASAQPWHEPDGFVLTYNGELWNPEAARVAAGGIMRTTGDTEPLARLLAARGPAVLAELSGMFAVAWVDQGGVLHLARDAYGEVPLHYGWTAAGQFVYASELKGLLALGAVPASVQWFPPGHSGSVVPGGRQVSFTRWYAKHDLSPVADGTEVAAPQLHDHLSDGVVGRMTADASIALLVSGGLDSSSVCGLVVAAGYRPELYTAVHDQGSRDLTFARRIADHFSLKLHEVSVPAPSPERLGQAVRAAEMPHKAQIEITLACLELARAVSSDGHRVILSGEGSDELWASYGTAFHGVRREGWHPYRDKLFCRQHRKNFARTNKVFMAAGVEARLPFLHPPLVRYALGLTEMTVKEMTPKYHSTHEKAVLARAMAEVIPHDHAWRRKAAFQSEARLDDAAAAVVADPKRFYAAEYAQAFRGVKP